MNVLEALRGEHAVIKALIADFERLSHQRSGRELRVAFALLEGALTSHAALEDALLFDRLVTTHAGISRALESMRDEHRAIRAKAAVLSRCPAETFRAEFPAFTGLVREHFAVEERVLLPLASQLVSARDLEEMGEEWAKYREVDLGA